MVIIALGESILVTGATFGGLERTPSVVSAFVVAFLGSVALWWIYFARHAEEGAHRIAIAADPARVGRGGYAYGHAIMVAGIIVTAVGDELILMHPTGHISGATAWVLIGGAVIFLIGNTLFNAALTGHVPIGRPAAMAALALLALIVPVATPIALAICVTAILAAVIVVNTRAGRGAGDLGVVPS